MNHLFTTLVIVAALLLMGGCSTTRHATAVQEYKRDSVKVEVKTETKYVRDTVFLEVPAQTAERTTADSTSHLENDYAVSDAKINKDGSLYHDLKTKPQDKPVPIQKPVEHKDSIIYRTEFVEKIVPVERELTKWQRTQMRGFWIVSAMFLIVVLRKPMLSLIRRFI